MRLHTCTKVSRTVQCYCFFHHHRACRLPRRLHLPHLLCGHSLRACHLEDDQCHAGRRVLVWQHAARPVLHDSCRGWVVLPHDSWAPCKAHRLLQGMVKSFEAEAKQAGLRNGAKCKWQSYAEHVLLLMTLRAGDFSYTHSPSQHAHPVNLGRQQHHPGALPSICPGGTLHHA